GPVPWLVTRISYTASLPTSTGSSTSTTSNRTAATPSAVTGDSALASSPRPAERTATPPAGCGPGAGWAAPVWASVRICPSAAATARSFRVTVRVLPAASDGSRHVTARPLSVPPSLALTYSNPSGSTV